MDEETRDKIFQSFFSTKGARGTGLGLMITKNILEAQGGIIRFESEPGKGSKFIIGLPEKYQPPGEITH
jgi:signal transduction histidine kinase